MPLGRKISRVTSLQAEQGWKEKSAWKAPYPYSSVSQRVQHLVCGYEKRTKGSKCGELRVYLCFELRLIHNQKAINLQRPQKYFSNN